MWVENYTILLQSVLVYLLENRLHLGRITIAMAVIPFYLSSINLLFGPMFVSAIFLLITLNYRRIKGGFVHFGRAHFWLKIQYFWFVTATIVFSTLVYENVIPYIPVRFFLGGLYLLIYIIWFNKINTKMTETGVRIILKGYTTETKRTLDFEPYLIPLIFTLMVTFTIASLQSLILTRGTSIFSPSVMQWYFPIVVLIIHFVVDLLFVEQIDWYPADGTTTWVQPELPKSIPSVDQPLKLARYTATISRLTIPPSEFVEYIDENLHFLVKNSQDLRYLPFQIHYVRAMANWGREGRDQIHLLTAIITASVSQYRFIGLIPLYKRKLFYEMLQVIAMTGSMTMPWRELIQYEVLEKKDEHYILDWVLGSRYLDLKYSPDWIISWEGEIYKGRTGYYQAVRKMEMMLQIRPEMTPWAIDLWELCRKYVHVYIGEDARQVASTNIQFFDQLLFLASKGTTEEYIKQKEAYKQSLLHPTDRLVIVERSEHHEYTEVEKEEIIDSYLNAEPLTSFTLSWREEIRTRLYNFGEQIRDLDLRRFMLILGYMVIFTANLGLIYLLERLFLAKIGILVVAIEIILLFFFSISPSDADLKIDDDNSAMTAVLSTSTFSQSSINVNSASMVTGFWYLAYGMLLLGVYRLILF